MSHIFHFSIISPSSFVSSFQISVPKCHIPKVHLQTIRRRLVLLSTQLGCYLPGQLPLFAWQIFFTFANNYFGKFTKFLLFDKFDRKSDNKEIFYTIF